MQLLSLDVPFLITPLQVVYVIPHPCSQALTKKESATTAAASVLGESNMTAAVPASIVAARRIVATLVIDGF